MRRSIPQDLFRYKTHGQRAKEFLLVSSRTLLDMSRGNGGSRGSSGQRCRGKKVHGQGLERRGAGPSHSRGRAYIKTPKKEGKNFGNRKKFDKKTDFPEAEVRRVTV